MRNRTLLIVLGVIVVAWFLMRGTGHSSNLPWNVGQAGTIFQGGHGGGGQ